MGTINYKTSDYITLGVELYDVYDTMHDPDFVEFAREAWGVDIDDETELYDAAQTDVNNSYYDDLANVKSIFDKYNFYYFHITIEPGYYEGFSLNIENNFSVAFDSWEDKRDAQKEITQIKAFLKECAGVGLVEVWPGWCTTYRSYTETITAIDEAIKEMRDEVRSTPTWRQYLIDCGEWRAAAC